MKWNTVESAMKTDIDASTIKRIGQARLVYVKDINRSIPPREGEPVGTDDVTKYANSHFCITVCSEISSFKSALPSRILCLKGGALKT